MSVLKSLVDWEKSRRDSENQGKANISSESGSATESHTKVGEDMHNNFEKAKAHKSTLEAAISEVSGFFLNFAVTHVS